VSGTRIHAPTRPLPRVSKVTPADCWRAAGDLLEVGDFLAMPQRPSALRSWRFAGDLILRRDCDRPLLLSSLQCREISSLPNTISIYFSSTQFLSNRSSISFHHFMLYQIQPGESRTDSSNLWRSLFDSSALRSITISEMHSSSLSPFHGSPNRKTGVAINNGDLEYSPTGEYRVDGSLVAHEEREGRCCRWWR